VSICATSSRNSTRTFRSGVRSDIRVSIHLTSPSPRLRTPFRPPSSDPIRTSVLVRITIRTLVIQLCSEVRSDIHVSFRLMSSSLCLWGPLGPPSLSALRVPRGSELLITVGHKVVSMCAAQVVGQWFHKSKTSKAHSSAKAFGYIGMSIRCNSTLREKLSRCLSFVWHGI
jgi:hypothetical protein